MKSFFVNVTKKILQKIIILFFQFNYGRAILDILTEKIFSNKKTIVHNNTKLKFYTPNRIIYWRAITFSKKEPQTLQWIDKFDESSIFFDIGANIGLYSCYAAKKKNCKVYAFEPSIFNLENLGRNIFLNDLSENITIIPNPITNEVKHDYFDLSDAQKGSAISTFGEGYKYDGKKLNSVFNYKIIGFSLDDLIEKFKIDKPNFLKIDVDGIEHLILNGAKKTLSNCKSVLVEVDEKFGIQNQEVSKILNDANFKLIRKDKLYENNIDSKFKNINNQIWEKIK